MHFIGYFWGLGAADLLAIKEEVGPPKVELIDWVLSCYKSNIGGFGGNKKQDASLLNTQHALYVLFQLEELAPFLSKNSQKLLSFIALQQHSDGSFSNDSAGEIDTRFSYCAIASLRLLYLKDSEETSFNSFCKNHEINLDKAIEYVLSCQNYDGGFGGLPSGESHAAYTWCCVAFLSISEFK